MKNLIATILFVTSVSTGSLNAQNDFIAPDSPTFRLGDYVVRQIEHISALDGEVRFNRIEVSVFDYVFENLAQYSQVYISIPNYYYNSKVNLTMGIKLYKNQSFVGHATDPVELLLSETMLAHLGFTVVDNPPYTYPPNQVNYFNPACWNYDRSSYDDIRLIFKVPYIAYSEPPTNYGNALRDITLFTELNVYYSDGYNDGFADGYDDGYIDGDFDGYNNGYNNGYNDGYNEGMEYAVNENISYSWLTGLFAGLGSLLSIRLFGDITIGSIALITLSLTLLPFIIGLAKGKGRD